MRGYIWNVFSGLSHLLNALTGGDPRVSFSARIGAASHRGSALAAAIEAAIDAILFSRRHCYEHAVEEGLL